MQTATPAESCQNNLEVRLYKPWFDKVDSKQQAALIIHEIVRGLSLKYDHSNMTDEGVAFLTRAFMQIDQYTEAQLVDIFLRTGVANDLAPYSAYVSLNQKVVIPKYREACMGSQRANIWQTQIAINEVVMNFTYSEGERDVAYKLMNATQTWSADEAYVRKTTCKIFSDHITKYQ